LPTIRAFAGFALFASGTLYGQSPAAPRFDVASVRPSALDQFAGSSGLKTGRGRLTATNVTLKRCVMGAFAVGPNQISGGPQWLDSTRYDIVAKADQPVDDDAALMAMLRTLLAERFQLALHRETRTMEAFVLEIGRHGPKLEGAKEKEATTRNGRGLIDARAITMDRLAEVLSRQMDLPVVNRTGLAGSFDLKLEWTPDSGRPAKSSMDEAADTGVSVFTAIQQQLGLRLRARKTPIATIVIDRAERPSEN